MSKNTIVNKNDVVIVAALPPQLDGLNQWMDPNMSRMANLNIAERTL